MKKASSTLIESFLTQVQAGNISAKNLGTRQRDDALSAVTTALKSILAGTEPDKALGIERKRGRTRLTAKDRLGGSTEKMKRKIKTDDEIVSMIATALRERASVDNNLRINIEYGAKTAAYAPVKKRFGLSHRNIDRIWNRRGKIPFEAGLRLELLRHLTDEELDVLGDLDAAVVIRIARDRLDNPDLSLDQLLDRAKNRDNK